MKMMTSEFQASFYPISLRIKNLEINHLVLVHQPLIIISKNDEAIAFSLLEEKDKSN